MRKALYKCTLLLLLFLLIIIIIIIFIDKRHANIRY